MKWFTVSCVLQQTNRRETNSPILGSLLLLTPLLLFLRVKRHRAVIMRQATGAETEEVMRDMGRISYSLNLNYEEVTTRDLGCGELSVVKHAHYNSIARTHAVYGKKGGSSDKENAQWSARRYNRVE